MLSLADTVSCSKQHTEIFLSVLQNKREPQITVVILARFLFRPVIFNRGFTLRLQYYFPVYIHFTPDYCILHLPRAK